MIGINDTPSIKLHPSYFQIKQTLWQDNPITVHAAVHVE